MNYNFFAYINRLKYIKRWQLMHSLVEENVLEHTQMVGMVAHALAVIRNKVYDGKVNIETVLLYSQYHETSEVITGDLPTPIKYYNAEINGAYKELERKAEEKILNKLPPELKDEFTKAVIQDTKSEEYKIMKCADKIAAYIKCVEEVKAGNAEFVKAKQTIKKDIDKIKRNEVKYFMKNIMPVYELTLDELD